MSKQESIREGIAKIVFSNGDFDDAKVFWGNEKRKEHYRWMADELLTYLHSQDVVIKGQSLGSSHPHLADYYTVEDLV